MRGVAKRAGLLVSLLTSFTVMVAPATASASVPTWVKNPASCTKVGTVAEKTSGSRYVQPRRGICGGTYYIWARANGDYYIKMGVWRGTTLLGVDRTQNGSGSTHYTQGRRADSGLLFAAEVSWTTPIAF